MISTIMAEEIRRLNLKIQRLEADKESSSCLERAVEAICREAKETLEKAAALPPGAPVNHSKILEYGLVRIGSASQEIVLCLHRKKLYSSSSTLPSPLVSPN